MPEQETDLMIAVYQKQADSKKIDELLQASLLDEIRRGNRDAIPKLVDSWEHIIITVIESERRTQIDNRSVSIEKMFNAGRVALTKVAEMELGSTGREIFFRFGAWCVRQAIIKELDQQGKL
jgi:phosphopantetheinyl transferase